MVAATLTPQHLAVKKSEQRGHSSLRIQRSWSVRRPPAPKSPVAGKDARAPGDQAHTSRRHRDPRAAAVWNRREPEERSRASNLITRRRRIPRPGLQGYRPRATERLCALLWLVAHPRQRIARQAPSRDPQHLPRPDNADRWQERNGHLTSPGFHSDITFENPSGRVPARHSAHHVG